MKEKLEDEHGNEDETRERQERERKTGSGSHWGRGHLETGRNMSGTLKGEELFTCHVTANPSLNVPTMYPHIPYRLHFFLSCIASSSVSYCTRTTKAVPAIAEIDDKRRVDPVMTNDDHGNQPAQ